MTPVPRHGDFLRLENTYGSCLTQTPTSILPLPIKPISDLCSDRFTFSLKLEPLSLAYPPHLLMASKSPLKPNIHRHNILKSPLPGVENIY